MKKSVYEIITEQIIKKLETGIVPWHKPWATDSLAPKNLVSNKPYSGINAILTHMQGYLSPYWITFKQAKELGGNVKQGEKGTPIVYWNFFEKEVKKANGEIKKENQGFLKYFTVFNIEQCDGITLKPSQLPLVDQRSEIQKLELCESIIKGFKNAPKLEVKQSSHAFYSPTEDSVTMPEQKQFKNDELFYSVLFHEFTHSTGHVSRLNRSGITNHVGFRSHAYSFEELVAEFGAAFLSGHAGIETVTLENSAAYISSWLECLKKDSTMLVKAANQAQKAVDLILGIKKDE